MKNIMKNAISRKFAVIWSLLIILTFTTSCKKEVCETYDPTCSLEGAFFLYAVLSAMNNVGKFIAVGEDGMIWSSEDGIIHTYATLNPMNYSIFPTGYDLNGIAYGNQTYVAVGDNGIVMYSTDGKTWTETRGGAPYDAAALTYYHFTDVVFGNGKFVAVGCQPDAVDSTICKTAGIPVVRWSEDGITWSSFSTSPAVGGVALTDIAFGNSLFYTAGDAAGTSSYSYNFDVNVWSPQPIGGFSDIGFGSNRFVATVGGSAATYYVDYTTGTPGAWTASAAPPQNPMLGITYTTDKYVTVGSGGIFSQSTSGDTWSDGTTGCTGNLSSVAFGNHRLVAVGGLAPNSSTCVNEDGTGSAWSETLEAGGTLNRVIFVDPI